MPFRFAFASPEQTRSRIKFRSNYATELRIVNTHFPVGVVVSIPSR
jgi:hypothetical protein